MSTDPCETCGGPTTSDAACIRDELAEWFESNGIGYGWADVLLASGVLDQVRADAWGEGVKAGRLDEVRGGFEPPTNPYRGGV